MRYDDWSAQNPPRLSPAVWAQAKAETLRDGMAVTPEVMQHIIDRGVALSRAAHVMVTSELVWRSIQNRIAADTWDRLYGKLFRGQQAAHRRRGAR